VNRSRSNAAVQWTAEEIGDRLGISTAVYQKMKLGAQHIAEIRQAGVKRIEISMILPRFDHRNRSQVKEIMDECEKQGVKVI
jgi:methylmalonyl-CoA mutase cobalamin-binding subunit